MQVKNDDRTKRIPVVVILSSTEQQDIVKCYTNGANSYIHKPVDFSKFIETVEKMAEYWLKLNQSADSQRSGLG